LHNCSAHQLYPAQNIYNYLTFYICIAPSHFHKIRAERKSWLGLTHLNCNPKLWS